MSTAAEVPRPRRSRGQRRPYGTGSLKQVGRSWIGTWYARDGRQVRRKVGDVRTPGQQDGLTITQAERKFASMRQNDPPRRRQAGDTRVTMKEAGERARPHARAQEPQEVPPAHGRLRPAQPHRPVLRGPTARGHRRRRHRALHRRQDPHARGQDRAQPTRCTRSSRSACARAGAATTPSSSQSDRPSRRPRPASASSPSPRLTNSSQRPTPTTPGARSSPPSTSPPP